MVKAKKSTKNNTLARKLTIFYVAAAIFVSAAFLVGCVSSGNSSDNIVDFDNISVAVADTEGVSITSDKLLKVKIGEDAAFDFILDEGIAIESISHGKIENGKIIIPDVYMPTVVRIVTRTLERCEFNAATSNDKLGGIESSLEDGTYWQESKVTLTALPKDDAVFTGFSIGDTFDNGGTLLSTESTYVYTITENVKIYANYLAGYEANDPALTVAIPEGKWVLLYHPNGGVIAADNDDPYLYATFSNEYYYCPNTLPSKGIFEREGYVLLGYNTKPDGTGKFYAPGWNVIMPERGSISLYCIWEKITDYSDFTFKELSDGSVAITKYVANDTKIVIPETYNGKPVSTIESNAFKNRALKTVIISRNIKTIADGAFNNCTRLQTLYFSDSVLNVSDNSFSGSTGALETIHMMATRYPAYAAQRNGTFSIKFEKLITAKKDKIILVSGSNTSFGVNSETLEEELLAKGYDYDIINYGTIAEECVIFIFEVISHFVDEGDVVVHLPEPKKDTQWGNNSFKDNYTWTVFECAYDAFSYVDMRNYRDFFNSFAIFNQARAKASFVTYERYTTDTVNRYGDYANNRPTTTNDLKNKFAEREKNPAARKVTYKSVLEFIEIYGDNLNRVYKMIGDSGATMLNSFASTARLYLTQDSAVPGGELQKQLETVIDTKFATTRISTIARYVFEAEWFYNSEYHLTSEGAIMRSKLLAEDLIAYFEKSKK